MLVASNDSVPGYNTLVLETSYRRVLCFYDTDQNVLYCFLCSNSNNTIQYNTCLFDSYIWHH